MDGLWPFPTRGRGEETYDTEQSALARPPLTIPFLSFACQHDRGSNLLFPSPPPYIHTGSPFPAQLQSLLGQAPQASQFFFANMKGDDPARHDKHRLRRRLGPRNKKA